MIIDMFGAGVRVETGGATITGNYIGVNASGSVAGFNSGPGINVSQNVDGVVITSNVISANFGHGILLSGTAGVAASDNNVIQGNIIGLDATGTNDLGNRGNGIAVARGNNNRIGGTTAGAGNVIGGNDSFGVTISALVVAGATGNTIQGNRDLGGVTPLFFSSHDQVLPGVARSSIPRSFRRRAKCRRSDPTRDSPTWPFSPRAGRMWREAPDEGRNFERGNGPSPAASRHPLPASGARGNRWRTEKTSVGSRLCSSLPMIKFYPV